MTVVAPVRNNAQRLAALRHANAIRSYRASIKRSVKVAGVVGAVVLIDEPREELKSMKLRDLLLAVPRFGDVRVDRMLRELQISPRKTVGGITDRQRALVVDRLREELPS